MIINKDELKKMITKSVLKSKTLKIKLENEIYLVKPGSTIIIRCFYDPIMETGPVWVFRRVTYEYVAANGNVPSNFLKKNCEVIVCKNQNSPLRF